MTIDLARRIEDASLRAWPALEQLVDEGGWVLRFASGFSKRANSVTAQAPAGDLADRVARCERHYAERGMPAIFRITSFAEPPGLDALLAARGYEKNDESLVMSLALTDGALADAGEIRQEGLEAWLDLFERFSPGKPARREVHRAMLQAIRGSRLLAVTPAAGAVGCGLGVLDGELFGLFDLVVAPPRRGEGNGRRLTRGMLAWARARRAEIAYLQVVVDNARARRLYERLGFEEAYRYWYRKGPAPRSQAG